MMQTVLERESGNGNGQPPFLLTAAGADENDDIGRYQFVFVDGQFNAVPTKN